MYRMEAKPVYLGTIHIVEVHPTEAVGKPVAPFKTPVQVDDRVASRMIAEK